MRIFWDSIFTNRREVVGQSLTNIARKTADWHADSFDPSSLILLAANLFQHNKLKSRVCLPYHLAQRKQEFTP